jgi:small subunit ribosomal protein S2
MNSIDKLMTTSSWKNLSKRERLQVTRERAKLEKNLGSIADMSRIPAALFIVDINKEKIAVAEARKLNIPTFAITDTNTDPTLIDFPIPANDDASKSIFLILNYVVSAVTEGLSERQAEREKNVEKKEKDEEDTLKEARLKADIKTKSENLKLAEEQADIEAEKEAAKKKAKAVKKPVAKKKDDNDD